MRRFEILSLAENGMRRGVTTGTCAAAAAAACIELLEAGSHLSSVRVVLPDEESFVDVPVLSVDKIGVDSARALVIKQAGDDPDVTDGASISVEIFKESSGAIRFEAGEGVGIVTAPGIRVAVGEPAINPVPRMMILNEIRKRAGSDFSCLIKVGCEEGRRIAQRTFNPRLGITGGISILGTTGIVEPMSLAAYRAAVEVYLRVALGEQCERIAILPGNIGIGFARQSLKLTRKRVVHISNFLGFSLEAVGRILSEFKSSLKELWLLGHPGKLAKCLGGYWDTHSKTSPIATDFLVDIAMAMNFPAAILASMAGALTVDAIISLISAKENLETAFWNRVERAIVEQIRFAFPYLFDFVESVRVKLFDYSGRALGGCL